jgi:hypothetical protein
LGTSGATEKSSISLLSTMPVPLATNPEPYQEFKVVVSDTAPPRASTIETCSVCSDSAPAGVPGPILSDEVARLSLIDAARAAT